MKIHLLEASQVLVIRRHNLSVTSLESPTDIRETCPTLSKKVIGGGK